MTRPPFIPRTATLELRLDGARVWRIRLTADHGRRLARLLVWIQRTALPAIAGMDRPGNDEDMGDAILSALWDTFGPLWREGEDDDTEEEAGPQEGGHEPT